MENMHCPVCFDVTLYNPTGVPNFRTRMEEIEQETGQYQFPTAFNVRSEEIEGGWRIVSSLRLNDNGFGTSLRPDTIIRLIDGDHSEYVEIIGYIDTERAYLVRLMDMAPTHVPKEWRKRRKKKS